jgi:hypothetical protein
MNFIHALKGALMDPALDSIEKEVNPPNPMAQIIFKVGVLILILFVVNYVYLLVKGASRDWSIQNEENEIKNASSEIIRVNHFLNTVQNASAGEIEIAINDYEMRGNRYFQLLENDCEIPNFRSKYPSLCPQEAIRKKCFAVDVHLKRITLRLIQDNLTYDACNTAYGELKTYNQNMSACRVLQNQSDYEITDKYLEKLNNNCNKLKMIERK